jgi:hypothetical protein
VSRPGRGRGEAHQRLGQLDDARLPTEPFNVIIHWAKHADDTIAIEQQIDRLNIIITVDDQAVS